MSAELSSLERLLRRDREVVAVALVVVILLAWIYTFAGAGMGMGAIEMSRLPWSNTSGQGAPMQMAGSSDLLVLLAMWWVMMVAMMLPSAAPVVLLAAALNRRSQPEHPPYGTAACFTLGYLIAWLLFSLVAAVAQWALARSGLLSSMLQSNSTYLTAGLLIAAGVWQFTAIKHACLRFCQSPIQFLVRQRRPGNRGALVMGLYHGTYCVGCCWLLMTLLFAGGVMNLFWIAGLAALVLVEKLFSNGVWFARIAGSVLIASGTALLVL